MEANSVIANSLDFHSSYLNRGNKNLNGAKTFIADLHDHFNRGQLSIEAFFQPIFFPF